MGNMSKFACADGLVSLALKYQWVLVWPEIRHIFPKKTTNTKLFVWFECCQTCYWLGWCSVPCVFQQLCHTPDKIYPLRPQCPLIPIHANHWKPRVVMPTMSPLMAPYVVVMTTSLCPVATKLSQWRLSVFRVSWSHPHTPPQARPANQLRSL